MSRRRTEQLNHRYKKHLPGLSDFQVCRKYKKDVVSL